RHHRGRNRVHWSRHAASGAADRGQQSPDRRAGIDPARRHAADLGRYAGENRRCAPAVARGGADRAHRSAAVSDTYAPRTAHNFVDFGVLGAQPTRPPAAAITAVWLLPRIVRAPRYST